MPRFPKGLATGPKGNGFSMVLEMASDRGAVDALREVNRVSLPAAKRQHFRDTSSPLQKT